MLNARQRVGLRYLRFLPDLSKHILGTIGASPRKTKSIKRYRLGKLRKQKRKRTFSEQFQFRFIGYKFTRRFFTAPGPLSPFHKVMKNVEFSTKTTLENRMQTTESAIIDEQGMLWFPPDGEDPLQTIKNRSRERPEDEENSHIYRNQIVIDRCSHRWKQRK